MISWINNIRIARKIAIVPVLALLFLIGLGLVANGALRDMTVSFDKVTRENVPQRAWAARLENQVQSTQTKIFQSLVWQAANAPEENQRQAREAVVDALKEVDAIMAERRDIFGVEAVDDEALNISQDRPADLVAGELEDAVRDLSHKDALRNLLWALELRLRPYIEAVSRTRSMQSTAFTAAVSFANSSQQAFDQVQSTVEMLQERMNAATERQSAAVDASFTMAERAIIGACLGALIVLSLIAFVVGNRIANPIHRITAAMRELAGGDTEIVVPERGRSDEVGDMAEALGVFQENAREVARLAAQEEENRRQAEIKRKETMHELAANIETSVKSAVDEVQRATDTLKQRAEGMAATADQTSTQTSTVAASAQEASANVENVSGGAQRLSESIAEIDKQVANSANLAQAAVDEAAKTDTTVQGLSDASAKIGDVVGLINDIAERTNLLALNATIEAARAGEAGKGFAVVANEVKNLASQTGKATEEISGEIEGIKTATGEAVSAIKSIGERVREINETLAHVSQAVVVQREETEDISRNSREAAVGTNDVSREIEGVRQAAASNGEASGTLVQTSDKLSQDFNDLNRTVQGLIEQIRAA